MRAKAAYIYVRGEFWHEANCLQRAVDEVYLCYYSRLINQDFLEKMHVVLVTISTSMFTMEQVHTFAVNKPV